MEIAEETILKLLRTKANRPMKVLELMFYGFMLKNVLHLGVNRHD